MRRMPELPTKDGRRRVVIEGITPQVDGDKYQIGLLLHSTPLQALEDLGKTDEVMPQKSTFFYPKLATGMVINPLR